MAAFLFLVTPLPRTLRKRVLNFLHTSVLVDKLKLSLKFTFAFILVLFLDSLNRVYRVQSEVSHVTDRNMANLMTTDRSELQARRFYSQRNMYLCGFTLFLSLILNRTYSMVLDLMRAEDTVQALKTGSDSSVKAGVINKESKDEIVRLKKLLAEKERDISTLKKQSEALSNEYMTISDEMNKKNGATPSNKKSD